MTNPHPLISVALCTWNGARWLPEQLDSVLAQTGVNLEIVALDDASSDESYAILERYAQRDSRLRVYRNAENLGHLRSFEKCMRLCTGDLIAPCDQDDIWLPEKLATLAAALGDADVVYCDSEYVDEQGGPAGGRISEDFDMFEGGNPLPLLFQNTVSGHAMLIRPSLLTVAGPAPSGLYHDWWLALCAAGNNGVRYCSKSLVQFRRHAQTSTTLGTAAARVKPPSRNRRWLAERIFLAQAYATSGLRAADDAHQFARNLEAAQGGKLLPMARTLWKIRSALPPNTAPGWLKAIKLFSRIRRKVSRARLEPSLSP